VLSVWQAAAAMEGSGGLFLLPPDFEALTQTGVPSQAVFFAAFNCAAADRGLLDLLDRILNLSLES